MPTNEYRPWTASCIGEVRSFERLTKSHAAIVGLWVNYPVENVTLGQLRAIGGHHSTPEITWEPWGPGPHTLMTAANPVLPKTIRGSYDAYIRSFARTLRAYRHTVYLRFGQEMNGVWFPWGRQNPASTFIGAWRHIHDVLRSQHATEREVGMVVTGGLLPGSHALPRLGLCRCRGLHRAERRLRATVGRLADLLADLRRLRPAGDPAGQADPDQRDGDGARERRCHQGAMGGSDVRRPEALPAGQGGRVVQRGPAHTGTGGLASRLGHDRAFARR